jgi:iron complex outermembrane recepter protein
MKLQAFCAGISLAAMTVAQPALAQEQPAAKAAASATPAEIVVTAQRRSESIQKVSIAMTAIGGDALAERGIASERDLQNATPGLTITKAGLTESVNIRGIGLASGSPQVANGVATYVDGLFQPPITQSAELYDIQSIEVLRGPQGTLVGSNSTGGAVFINTRRPVLGKLGGDIDLEAGSYNNFKGEGAINVPIGDDFALRFATDQHTRDSYYNDIGVYHNRPDRLDTHEERLSALYKRDGLSIYWKGELTQNQNGGYAYQPIAGTQFSAGATGVPYQLDYDSPTTGFERAFNTALEIKYQTPGGLIIRSETGYQNKRINNTYDLDATSILSYYGPGAGFPQYQDQWVRERQYSQEINIISPTTGAFNYILGGYFQRNKIDVLLHITGTAPFEIVPNPITDKVVWGLFAQGNLKLNDKFEIQAGVRYSQFHVDGTGAVYLGGMPPAAFSTISQAGTETDGLATGKVSLNYTPDSNNLVYVFAARGYKPGGINPPGQTFLHEEVWDFEAGWKSSFLSQHIRTQIGAFYNAYRNFQIDGTLSTGQAGVFNVPGTSTIKGFEASAQAALHGWTFDFGGAYVHSHLPPFPVVNQYAPGESANLPQCTGGAVFPACFDYVGNTITNPGGGPNLLSPEWTWNVSLAHRFALQEGVALEPRVNFNYVGAQEAHLTYLPQDRIDAYHLLSASIALTWQGYKLEAFGTNLTKEYYESGVSGANEFFGAPREFGVRFMAKF